VIHEVSRAGELLAEAVSAGATSVSSINFTRSDVRQVYRDQLVVAFEDARAKAAQLAASAGLTLGSPLAIEESGFRASVDEFSPNAGGDDAATAPGAEPVIPPIKPGKTAIKARVFVVFEAQ
jgi:uncharacterized protein YggE